LLLEFVVLTLLRRLMLLVLVTLRRLLVLRGCILAALRSLLSIRAVAALLLHALSALIRLDFDRREHHVEDSFGAGCSFSAFVDGLTYALHYLCALTSFHRSSPFFPLLCEFSSLLVFVFHGVVLVLHGDYGFSV
jgi:hypothetical protein